jgi:uncharacterized membrane protein
MRDKDIAENNQSKLMGNIVVVAVFLTAMASAITYFNNSEPSLKAQIMDTLAEQFKRNALSAHWQWQAEGRPRMIMLVQYEAASEDSNDVVKERGRQPLRMAANGWPHVDNNSESCEALWQSILYVPAEVDGFRVIGEYFEDGVDNNGDTVRRCRFRVSTGTYFDYYVNSGRVIKND